MFTSTKSRLLSLLVFVMVFAMIACAMSVFAFAEDGHDHDGDGVDDHTGSTTETKKETTWDKITKWGASKTGQITGFCIAGVLFVAMVVFIILWIPKKTDKKEKKIVAKNRQQ